MTLRCCVCVFILCLVCAWLCNVIAFYEGYAVLLTAVAVKRCENGEDGKQGTTIQYYNITNNTLKLNGWSDHLLRAESKHLDHLLARDGGDAQEARDVDLRVNRRLLLCIKTIRFTQCGPGQEQPYRLPPRGTRPPRPG